VNAAAHLLGATALLAVAALADAALRRRGAHALRGALWAAAAAQLVLGPFLAARSPAAPVIGLAAPAPAVAAARDWSGALLAGWALGACAWTAVGVVRAVRFRARLARGATPAPADVAARATALAARLGLRATPRVFVNDAVVGPCVVGPWRAAVHLPARVAAGPALDHALLHELAHLRRGDLVVAAGVALLRAAYWFHPLVGLLARRCDELCEIGCDAAAARAADGGPDAYRRTLLAAAAERFAVRAPAFAAAWFGPRATIVVRLRSLEGAGPPRRARRCAAACVALAAFACAPTFDVVAESVGLAPASAPAADPAFDEAAAAVYAKHLAGGRESCLAVRHAVFHLAARAEAGDAPAR
jgi:bla regulator protein BlaR1